MIEDRVKQNGLAIIFLQQNSPCGGNVFRISATHRTKLRRQGRKRYPHEASSGQVLAPTTAYRGCNRQTKALTTTRNKNIRNTRHLRNIPGKQEMTIAEELASLYNFGLEGPVATNWESSCAGQQCTNPSSEPQTTVVCTKPAAERQEEKPGMRLFQHKRSKHARVSRKSAQSSTVAADAAVASDETIDYGREGALGGPLFLGRLGETTATTGVGEGRRHATGQQQSRPK